VTAGGGDALCFASARDLASAIRTREVSAREVMEVHLARIERLNPQLNAIVAKLDDDACLSAADDADAAIARGDDLGPLHGLPTAFKDTEPAVGFPYTMGSTIFRTFQPPADSVLIERLRRAGVVPIGKTNVPEFGMGSHTYNSVYGTTRNPYDLSKSAGGSSGGAAAALAAGLLPIADGSDYGGSLRNPANFNNVVALRPTVGLVPGAPSTLPFAGYVVKGMLARTVADVGLGLSAVAGIDLRDPLSYPSDPASFAAPLDRDLAGVRVAWCPVPGDLPLDHRVRAVVDGCRATFEELGCIVEDAEPPLEGAEEAFRVVRSWATWHGLGPLLAEHRDEMKPEAVAQIESGASLTGHDVAEAMRLQGDLLQRMRRFHERFDVIVGAVNQVPPFPADIAWPTEIEGVAMETYLDWMRSACWYSATFQPALSVPAGFTPEGLPVGIQIAGRRHDDLFVLQVGRAFEQATGVGKVRPPIALA
jgi:amidase